MISVPDAPTLEHSTWDWQQHLGPILASKLFTILSGSAGFEGTIPRSTMSHDLKLALERVVRRSSHSFFLLLITYRQKISLVTPVGLRFSKRL